MMQAARAKRCRQELAADRRKALEDVESATTDDEPVSKMVLKTRAAAKAKTK